MVADSVSTLHTWVGGDVCRVGWHRRARGGSGGAAAVWCRAALPREGAPVRWRVASICLLPLLLLVGRGMAQCRAAEGCHADRDTHIARARGACETGRGVICASKLVDQITTKCEAELQGAGECGLRCVCAVREAGSGQLCGIDAT
jgi:hypothetical protein